MTSAALGGWSKKTRGGRSTAAVGWTSYSQLESFIMTKLTKPSVRVNLVGPQVSFRNGAPQMSGGGIIFWAGEARISEIEEEARHPLDGHPTDTAARTVC